MKCNTRDFGEIDIREEDILDFVQPPFGFEQYKRYTLICDDGIGHQIAWLQSVEEPSVCFILFDPSSLSSFYQPEIGAQTEEMLGEGELVCWVIGVVPEDVQNVTVNLKSPILICTDTNRAAQVILEQDYPIRHPLMKGAL